MSELKIVVTGASGRMGGRIIRVATETDGVTVAGASDRPGAESVGRDAGTLAGIGELGVVVAGDLADAIATALASEAHDSPCVVIDFTTAAVAGAHASACASAGVSLVLGTTALDDEGRRAVEAAAGRVPVLMAPNTSLGANLLVLLARKAAESLGVDFDVEILETHHKRKADAPSGTAMRLGEVVAEALGRDLRKAGVYHREGMPGPRTDDEIGFQTLRGGDVVGEHTVYYFGDGERLELTHRAGSRDIFAKGALRAARWLSDRRAGLYGMEDVLRIS